MNLLKIVGKPHKTCGVEYVEVETKYGIAMMLKDEVDLRNRLITLGLPQIEIDVIMDLAMDYAHALRDESDID